MRKISVEERRRRLGLRHHLMAPIDDVERVAEDLVGLHSSDPVTVYLAARARMQAMTVADLDRALYEERSLVRILGNRRTLFVVPPELAAVIHEACTRTYAPAERRRLVGFLEDQLVEGDGDQWLDGVMARTLDALRKRGEATARELVSDVEELGGRLTFGYGKTWGGTFGLSTRLLFLLATNRQIVRARPLGSWKSSQYRWSPLEDWIEGGLPEVDPERARRELVERWLRAFGPGTLTDVKWWTGWSMTQTRLVLEEIGAIPVALDGGEGYVLADDLAETGGVEDWVALLPGLDPTVMGWKERAWYLSDYEAELFDTNGNAGPTVWWNGRVVGGWGQGSDAEVRFELLEAVPAKVVGRIEEEAARLTQWLDGVVIKPRFGTALEKRLRV